MGYKLLKTKLFFLATVNLKIILSKNEEKKFEYLEYCYFWQEFKVAEKR